MKKRFLLFGFLFILIIIFSIKSVFALGLSPGKHVFNFEPNFETSIVYKVLEDNPEQELEIYISGDLADFVKIDRKNLVGGGFFGLNLKLPEHIEPPGKHIIYVGVKQKIDEELSKGTVGTSVVIQGIIVINVPYPGKYVDVSLNSHNVNVGEPVNFEISLISRGDEDVEIFPRIEIISQEKTIETLFFQNRFLKSQEQLGLKKTLDTTNYNPGTYDAVTIVDYGKIAEARTEFKIGELIIDILNYTRKITIEGVQKFDIEIQSGWNNKIDGAYAEVNIFNNSNSLISFKTSTTELIPWEKKTITGYFDTTGFIEGIYDANISVIYFGKDVGKSTNKLVQVEFVKELNIILIGAVILGILVILAVIIFISRKYIYKKKKKLK